MLVNRCFADKLFEGKTVFVTGGGSGINLGIARNFAALGANSQADRAAFDGGFERRCALALVGRDPRIGRFTTDAAQNRNPQGSETGKRSGAPSTLVTTSGGVAYFGVVEYVSPLRTLCTRPLGHMPNPMPALRSSRATK